MKTPNFMIIFSLSCQASCNYCFGPYEGKVMTKDIAKESIAFIQNIYNNSNTKKFSITFHGGEPLLAPIDVWKTVLNEIKISLAEYELDLGIQSNLWNLNVELLDLFKQHNVHIGTSIDGPQEICDINRGEGYFNKTFKSMNLARRHGCDVGAIATITPRNMEQWKETLEFFKNNDLSLSLHESVPQLDNNNNKNHKEYVLSPDDYLNVVKDIFPWYVTNSKAISISNLDYFCKGIVFGNPEVCTFNDCFGMFLAIDPLGDIYACQRFVGNKNYVLGNIAENPSIEDIYNSPNGKKHLDREKNVRDLCSDCSYYEICKGGCYYNAEAACEVIDPYCKAYNGIYSFVEDKIIEEMSSEENIAEFIAKPNPDPDEHLLLRKGDYISLAGKIHPSMIAGNARMILAINELAKTSDPSECALNLYNNKICGKPEITNKILENIQKNINHLNNLNNCYIYLTYNCNLECSHCYAYGGENTDEMEITNYEKLLKEANKSGFQKIVIVGGEPLIHSQKDRLLEISKKYRGKNVDLILRTNLSLKFTKKNFLKIAESFDQVVVSVDGNQKTHNNRRGEGSYEKVVENLKKYVKYSKEVLNSAELSLACVMNSDEINGEPGDNVKRLGSKLGVKKIRFNPLLPLGRASYLEKPVISEGLKEHISPDEMLKNKIYPIISCGIGQNIMIKPDGSSFPCYAWCGEHTFIGNVFEKGLSKVLKSEKFQMLKCSTVDTIEKCKECEYRYLCGGACRAWGNQNTIYLNAAPVECEHLKLRAQKLITASIEYLDVS